MKRKALAAIMAVAMAVSMAGCGGSTSESKDSTQKTETADSTASTGGSVENKDKPLCWFNRQPSSSATGELDKEALNFNADTYYVVIGGESIRNYQKLGKRKFGIIWEILFIMVSCVLLQ